MIPTAIRNIFYRNKLTVERGNQLVLPASAASRLKKTRIKIRGKNNRLIVGEGADITNCEIRLSGRGNVIEIGSNVRFKRGKIYLLETTGQHIRIGADTTVEGAYLLVDEAASIEIGRDCMLSSGILIRIGDKHSILCVHSGARLNPSKDVRIADRVWLGRDAQVLKGSVIPPDSVVATRSVVTSAFQESGCVLAGVPARVVRRDVKWDRQKL